MSKIRKAAEAQGTIAPQRKEDPVTSIIRRMGPAIERALPSHMDASRFARIMTTIIRSTPELAECLTTERGRTSLLGALMQCAQLGLEPGPLGQAYIIPFRNKGVQEAVFVPGYRGLIDLARRSGHIRSIYANEVREADHFVISYGVGGTLEHKPDWKKSDSPVVGYYAFAELVGGGYQFTIMSKDQVEAHRRAHSKAKYGPWKDHFDEMAKKTLIRRLAKSLPMTVEYMRAEQADGQAVQLTDEGELIDVETVEVPQITRLDPEHRRDQSHYVNWKKAHARIGKLLSECGADDEAQQAFLSSIALQRTGSGEVAYVTPKELEAIAEDLAGMSCAEGADGDLSPRASYVMAMTQ